jgi:hypothetical protein
VTVNVLFGKVGIVVSETMVLAAVQGNVAAGAARAAIPPDTNGEEIRPVASPAAPS